MILTYKFRLRDKHAAELNRKARAVNVIWNYCNEAQRHVLRWDRWFSAFDLMKMTAGSGKDLGLLSNTIQRVCRSYVAARIKARTPWIRWRGVKSLGWVPFNTGSVTFDGASFRFCGVEFAPMHLRSMKAGIKIGAGSFNQDARGRWYINCPIEVASETSAQLAHIGMDLGLKDLACLSDGQKIAAPRFYREAEARLATAQRTKKTKRARAIQTKVANRRRDFLHKASARVVKQYGLIVIGDVSPSKLAKTRFAKSVLDAGWADFKRMLSYKAIMHGGSTLEVSEAFTSQVCSECGTRPPSRPKGIADLSKRSWCCDDCGAIHDRDVNAARNILRIGLDTLWGGTALARGGAAKGEIIDTREAAE